jgi:DNA repair exonuclease SbcCD ATPase subunit
LAFIHDKEQQMAVDVKPYFLEFDSRFDMCEHAEQLMARIVRGELDRDSPDFQFITQRLGWSKWKVNIELGRVENALALKPETLGDNAYAQAIEFAEATKKEKGKKIEALSAKIEALQSELTSAQAEIKKAEQPVLEIEEKREKLRNLNPAHIKEFINKSLSEFHSTGDAKLLHDLKDRKRMIQQILELDPNSRSGIMHAEAVIPEHFVANTQSISKAGWDAYIERVRAELVEVEHKIEELQRSIAEDEASIVSGLDYYVQGFQK